MELKLVMMAFEGLSKRVEDLKKENEELRNAVNELRRKVEVKAEQVPVREEKPEDELLTLKSAIGLLKVSRSGFIRMVNDGIFKPIKLNLRTLRYSKKEILQFIRNH